MQEYIRAYSRQLVDSSHFINMFYEKYSDRIILSKQELKREWLHSPGVPEQCSQLLILNTSNCDLYLEVVEAFKDVTDSIKIWSKKRKKDFIEFDLELR